MTVKASLMPFGFIISGPMECGYVASADDIPGEIARLIQRGKDLGQESDEDDYTATEVFAKAWRGAVRPLEESIPVMREGWDAVYARQIKEAE